uniref:Multifunctional methyltransferase subunit TRM112-like protein n=1 Tax=Eucampia antarctica TaxID=49252 RepID=A0A7S2RNB3_9STRA|mmetsp:Transcript_24574/g.23614  ORF Transcript_24574/g.23614 Transcript_24574/m.23614 type:complete len:130 (+) Transcript_24574:105-494(+)|eukprot:CAMPEP_0197837148 /NCGR_PEP_ID=MMETSP1437-20131217/31267_1 /TAXON_ID=49252 ORGANISM="Eucampia antarctica, Strain CCMP1452" /NCGR_SAMPLE_ID=MMETSP1437 /ASSEMBLY_ACC=CAM_ASM_001096 /LENGTH=129 /DNA_ID=CAMNT_0043443947 /DNA_START=105 /DNA_END=494 /DNA_ORIENTATION=+
MRLVTHNYLQSNVKGTEKGYPLIIEATKIELEESPVDYEFLQKLLPKLKYDALLSAVQQIRSENNDIILLEDELPSTLPSDPDEALLRNLHKILFDLHIVEGHLKCPDTARTFPITQGIPNMILHEDEI